MWWRQSQGLSSKWVCVWVIHWTLSRTVQQTDHRTYSSHVHSFPWRSLPVLEDTLRESALFPQVMLCVVFVKNSSKGNPGKQGRDHSSDSQVLNLTVTLKEMSTTHLACKNGQHSCWRSGWVDMLDYTSRISCLHFQIMDLSTLISLWKLHVLANDCSASFHSLFLQIEACIGWSHQRQKSKSHENERRVS